MNRLLGATASLALLATPVPAQPADERPALVVAVVVDQLSANLFNQYRPHFRHGLRRLADQGLVHINGYHAHANTVTCAGHATILTGTHPATNGVIRPTTGSTPRQVQDVYCLAAPENALAHGGEQPTTAWWVRDRMHATTLGDWLKARRSGRAERSAVSGKDRGAIALAGQNGDGAFWLTVEFGLTTYVRPGQTRRRVWRRSPTSTPSWWKP